MATFTASPSRRYRHSRGTGLRRTALAVALSAGAAFASPKAARAASDEDKVPYDARVQGYTPEAESKSSSVGLVWLLTFLLGGGCVGVMFMNARRSHLD